MGVISERHSLVFHQYNGIIKKQIINMNQHYHNQYTNNSNNNSKTNTMNNIEAGSQTNEKLVSTPIYKCMVISGEKERLKRVLNQRLMEIGWKEEMTTLMRQVLREKGSFEHLTTEDLATMITPKARDTVPDDIKEEILKEIRDFIDQNQL